MNGKSQYIPSFIIAAICITIQLLHKTTISAEISKPLQVFSYSFIHVNIFHLALNLIALFQFRPRWKTCLIGYLSCTLAYIIPFSQLSVPTLGLSGFIMACFARKYQSHRIPLFRIILSNIPFAFIPVFNWKIHLLSFFIAYFIYGTIHSYRTYRAR